MIFSFFLLFSKNALFKPIVAAKISNGKKGNLKMAEHHTHTNRLISQKSPYLLQHAHNPVDWYPWGNEAFQAAKDQDKPIFLSIGYATCHWCHVMEKESFEDEEVAKLLNDSFINIKVDREELPEIDSLYMEFAQSMMAGAAGWPLNVLLTPELLPFFAATYLPPQNKHGLMGLVELVTRIKEVWNSEERERVINQAEKIVEVFAESIHIKGDDLPEKEQITEAAEQLFKLADPIYGGMKGVPKFPIAYQYDFMLRHYYITKDSRAIFLVEKTLDMMSRGGIYDHLVGGFSRYSVDENWVVPHFEKMLYDNALLAYSYLETWQMTKKELYKTICIEILNYILKDMTHKDGGFYSAEDADSEGHEGYYYTWPYEEVISILGASNESDLFCEYYDITPAGNFEGRNILNTKVRLEEFCAKKQLDLKQTAQLFEKMRSELLAVREKRPHPLKDDKVITSWNGLMIHSMSESGAAWGKKDFVLAAERAAQFIYDHMWKEGVLYRRWRENEAMFPAALDEYAFLTRGLISLFETGRGSRWLAWAIELNEIVMMKFKEENGAFYQTDGMDSNIILRKCQFADGAEPSGNSIQGENLIRLYQLTGQIRYLQAAEDVFKAVKHYTDNYSPGYCYHLICLARYYDRQAPTIVVALNEQNEYFEELRELIYQNFIPNKAIIWRQEGDVELFKVLPFVKEQRPVDGQTTVYICHQGVCLQPLVTYKDIIEAINKL